MGLVIRQALSFHSWKLQIRNSAENMDGRFIKVYTSDVRNTPWIFSETLRIIEGFNEEAVAQNTDSVRDGIPAKWSNGLVLRDIFISLFYLLHPIVFLLL